MRKKRLLFVLSLVLSLSSLFAGGEIFLYGEQHGAKQILDYEVKLWSDYYHQQRMRHLFIEYPNYVAQLLNRWMVSDDDEILDTLYEEWKGSPSYNPTVKDFFKSVKEMCPQTIFHGIDVGHFYWSTGERFLALLKEEGVEKSELYQQTIGCIEQGKHYYEQKDSFYREQQMVNNFIEEFESLEGESVMGIFGGAHVTYENQNTNMASQLKKRYGGCVHSKTLHYLLEHLLEEPLSVQSMEIGNKKYQASYFGRQFLAEIFPSFLYRDFWRVEDAYDDMKDKPKNSNVLPYTNYPMTIHTNEVFIVEYCLVDGTLERQYFRSDGSVWKGRSTTEQFLL